MRRHGRFGSDWAGASVATSSSCRIRTPVPRTPSRANLGTLAPWVDALRTAPQVGTKAASVHPWTRHPPEPPPWTSWSPSSLTSSATWPTASSRASTGPSRCRPPSWCTRPTCASRATRGLPGWAAPTSTPRPHAPCGRCWWMPRGAGLTMLSLDEHVASVEAYGHELLGLDDALKRLESRNPRHARVVECRFFGGMSVEDTAEALQVSPRTVKSDWSLARAWLYEELKGDAT